MMKTSYNLTKAAVRVGGVLPSPKLLLPMAPNGYPNVFYTEGSENSEKILSLIDQAFERTLKRIDIHHVDPVTGKISTYDFFEKVDRIITDLDPDAKSFVYGGVVRSFLGYLYAEIYKVLQKESGPNVTEEVLENMAKEELSKRLSRFEVLGIGSDLDLLIDYIKDSSCDKNLVSQKVVEFVNSAQKGGKQSAFTRSFIADADVREYEAQIARSTRQGGSSLDWLAFPITPRSGSMMRMPDGHPDIMRMFLKGRVHYLPTDMAEDSDQTIARMVRPLLEIPCLEPSEASLPLVLRSIKDITGRVKRQEIPISKVAYQVEKGVRNARFAAVCNFFAAPHPRNTELEISIRALSREQEGIPLIPEFLDSSDIEGRSADFDPGDFKQKGYLISEEEFLQNHTDQGILYHGTPDAKNMLSMMRTGLIVSTEQTDRPQGSAVHGRGFYMTNQRSVAQVYSRSGGACLAFSVKVSSKLRILALSRLSQDVRNALEKEAASLGQDLHEYLAKQYSIDIVVSGYILIQNMKSIAIPENAEQWIQSRYRTFVELLNQAARLDPETQEKDLEALIGYWTENAFLDDLNGVLCGQELFIPAILNIVLSSLQDVEKNKDFIRKILKIAVNKSKPGSLEIFSQLPAQIKEKLSQILNAPFLELLDKSYDSGKKKDMLDLTTYIRDNSFVDHMNYSMYGDRLFIPKSREKILSALQDLDHRVSFILESCWNGLIQPDLEMAQIFNLQLLKLFQEGDSRFLKDPERWLRRIRLLGGILQINLESYLAYGKYAERLLQHSEDSFKLLGVELSYRTFVSDFDDNVTSEIEQSVEVENQKKQLQALSLHTMDHLLSQPLPKIINDKKFQDLVRNVLMRKQSPALLLQKQSPALLSHYQRRFLEIYSDENQKDEAIRQGALQCLKICAEENEGLQLTEKEAIRLFHTMEKESTRSKFRITFDKP